MKKIYNNLNIKNLTKTDWFNQFNKEQKIEILIGIKANIDVSIYAKTEINPWQMAKIKIGLEEKKINALIYAKLICFVNKVFKRKYT